MKSAKIGSPTLAKPFNAEGQDFLFPLTVEVKNNSPRTLVDPDSKLGVGPHGEQVVTVQSVDDLQRMVTNIEAIAEFNGYTEIAVLRFQQPETAKSTKKPTPKPKPVAKESSTDADAEAKPKPRRNSATKQTEDQAGGDK